MDELRKEYRQTACFERCIYGRIGKTDERHVAGRTDNRDGYPSGRQLHHLTGRTSECRHLEFYQYVRTRQFLVRKGKVSFLYNKYDIAPYAVGVITLSLPYTSVENI